MKFKKRARLLKTGIKTISCKLGSVATRLRLKKVFLRLFRSWKGEIISFLLSDFGGSFSLPDKDEIARRIKKHLTFCMRLNLKAFEKQYNQELLPSPSFKDIDIDSLVDSYLPEVTDILQNQYNTFIKRVGEVVKENITTSTGYRLDDYPKARKTLKDILQEKFDNLSDKRAKFLARDQSAKINAELNRQTQEAAGIKYFRWLTVRDSRVSRGRGGHDKLDGKIYAWDDKANLPVIDSYGRRGVPSERPNCRCTAEAVIILPDYQAVQQTDGSYKIVRKVSSSNSASKVKTAFRRIVNAKSGDNWITVKGNHIKLKDGESKEQAVKRFVESKKKSFTEILGDSFKGFKGVEAINKLMKEKRGYVPGAFYRNDIGNIALVWGNSDFGLKHVIERRKIQGIDITNFLKDIAEVIEKGKFIKTNEKGRYEIYLKHKIAVIEPEIANNKITFLLTAFKRRRL